MSPVILVIDHALIISTIIYHLSTYMIYHVSIIYLHYKTLNTHEHI